MCGEKFLHRVEARSGPEGLLKTRLTLRLEAEACSNDLKPQRSLRTAAEIAEYEVVFQGGGSPL